MSTDDSKLTKVVASIVDELGHVSPKIMVHEVQTSATGQPSLINQSDDSAGPTREDSDMELYISKHLMIGL